MTTYLGKSCSFCLRRVPFVNCRQFMYLVILPFGFEGRIWDLIVSVPDYCLSFYFVFGVNSSLFLAQFVLQRHAKHYGSDFPIAAETVEKSTYMDDSLDSVQTEEQGRVLYNQLSKLLSKAGMHARKWLSNSSSVLADIPVEDRKAEVDLDRSQLPCTKTLGVWWLADQDVFTFKETAPDDSMVYTKRNFLKKIATLFDPIGFLAPFTILAKMLLQDM